MRAHLVYRFFFTICIAFFGGLAACSSALPTSSPTEVPTSAAATLVSMPTHTPVPSATPAPPVVLFLAPPGSDPALTSALQPILEELSLQAGLQFQVQPSLLSSEIQNNLRLVVALPPDPGMADLAAAAPTTQFLALGITGLNSAENLSVIGGQGGSPDQQGFLAGYLAAVITEDARVGVISVADTAAGQAARQGFLNGVIFYCGLCRPSHPPFFQYPAYAEFPAGASQAEQQAAADTLIATAVKTIYVYPGTGDASLLEYLAEANINLIGGITPPTGLQNQWVASIQADWPAAIRDIWPEVLAGNGGATLDLPLAIGSLNEDLFSPGRQRLVEETRANLLAGFVDTGVEP